MLKCLKAWDPLLGTLMRCAKLSKGYFVDLLYMDFNKFLEKKNEKKNDFNDFLPKMARMGYWGA